MLCAFGSTDFPYISPYLCSGVPDLTREPGTHAYDEESAKQLMCSGFGMVENKKAFLSNTKNVMTIRPVCESFFI